MVQIPAGTYAIDTSHSEVSFTARHAGVARVRGRFADYDGTIVVGDDLAGSSARARIAAASVDTGDPNRDTHLRSTDFFDAKARPEWHFQSTGVRADGENLVLTGDLTINDVTKPVDLDVEYHGTATDPYGNQRLGFSAQTQVSRKDFGLTWNVALEAGGVLVGDKVRIGIEVSAVRQA